MAFAEADISEIIAAIGALGTAAFALVDATKAYKGGVSNIGYSFITTAVAPYEAALRLVDASDPYATIRASRRGRRTVTIDRGAPCRRRDRLPG